VFRLTTLKSETNHMWKGALPSLTIKDIIIIRSNIFLLSSILNIENIKNIEEETPWIRKYFIVFSNILFPLNDIKGKNPNMFISRDIHNMKQEFELKDNKILAHKNKKKPINGVKIIFIGDIPIISS